jgi:prolyl-tRNA synthetase
MGTYGIGLGRLLAAAVEQNHDDKGIIWPVTIAPYHVYLCPLRLENPDVAETAEKLYQDLTRKNLEVLFDDRDESPGVKFNDADLLGIPLRLTISPRTLQNQSIEVKWRKEEQVQILSLKGITTRVKELLQKT